MVGAEARIDPLHLRVTGTIRLTPGANGLVLGYRALWATTDEPGTLWKLDPASGDVLAATTLGHAAKLAAFANGSLWVALSGSNQVVRIAPESAGV